MRKAIFLSLAVVFSLAVAGCTTTQKGAGIGGVGGALIGGIIGHQSGHTTEGALIGAGAGAVSGALIGEQMNKKFCPVCGAQYTGGQQYCPKDGAELKPIQK
jgi:uncharacterized protein YcfJ